MQSPDQPYSIDLFNSIIVSLNSLADTLCPVIPSLKRQGLVSCFRRFSCKCFLTCLFPIFQVDNDHNLMDDMILAEVLSRLYEMIKNGGNGNRADAVRQLRDLLKGQDNPPDQQVVGAGFIPLIVPLLDYDDDVELQANAAGILTNLSVDTHQHCTSVVDSGAPAKLIRLMSSSPSDKVREQVMWALSNIAADCKEYKHLLLSNGVGPPLLSIVNTSYHNASLMRQAMFLFRALAFIPPPSRGGGSIRSVFLSLPTEFRFPPEDSLSEILDSIFLILMEHELPMLLEDTLWSLRAIIRSYEMPVVRQFWDSGIVDWIMDKLLRSKSPSLSKVMFDTLYIVMKIDKNHYHPVVSSSYVARLPWDAFYGVTTQERLNPVLYVLESILFSLSQNFLGEQSAIRNHVPAERVIPIEASYFHQITLSEDYLYLLLEVCGNWTRYVSEDGVDLLDLTCETILNSTI